MHPGDAVVARILTYPTRLESGTVTLERRIGGDDAPDLGVQYVMARYGYTDSYPEAALAEAEALSLDVTAALKDPLRRDLRDRFVITIDPVDARDFDDAISLERTPEGGYKLGVHIADVSHYVAWDGHIDLEARHRTTSVYLADRVLPMLPERLSNDLCSLRPDEDRLAFTVDIELDAQGRVRHYDPYPSAIRSRVRMDYDGAEALLVRAAQLSIPCWRALRRMSLRLKPRARKHLSAGLRARTLLTAVTLTWPISWSPQTNSRSFGVAYVAHAVRSTLIRRDSRAAG